MSSSSLTKNRAATSQVIWSSGHVGPRKSAFRREEPLTITVSTAAYLLFLMLNATLFLRPAELISSLEGMPIYEGLILGSLVLTLPSLQRLLSWRSLRQQPVCICVAGVLLATVLSHLSHVYLFGAYEAFTEFSKTILFFLLLVCTVNTPERFRGLLLTVAVVGTAMISLCVIDYAGIHDFQFITHINDRNDTVDATGEEIFVLRMRGTGIFEDPNDLGMVIVCCGVICTYFLLQRRRGWMRFAWLLPILLQGVALIFTRSRGSLLAACVAGMTLIALYYGRKATILAVVCAGLALPLIAGRQANIDLEDGTGHQRIELWREGMAALTGPNLLLGIGYEMYPDLAGLVAHNSFVHSYVELGLFGGTLFFGCFAFTLLALYRLSKPWNFIRHPELRRAVPFVAALLVGWCTSMISLSRCYIVPTYLIIGIGASFTNLACLNLRKPHLLVAWKKKDIQLLMLGSFGFFCCIYLFVRVMG